MVGQLLFILLTVVSVVLFSRKAKQLHRNIFLGKPEKIGGQFPLRLQNVLLVAFGQQKMFKKWLPAVLHLFIYVAFVITQIELLEIFVDGFTGNHRLIWQTIEGTIAAPFYTFIISSIEVLSVLAFVATFAFLARRNLLHIPRFQMPEMRGWAKLDGNNILFLEIALIIFIFMMNAGDAALQQRGYEHYHHTETFAISQFLVPFLTQVPDSTVFFIERTGWWGHILVVFFFLNYLPYSKHLHILLAFPNVYFARLNPKGEMKHSEAVTHQIQELVVFNETPVHSAFAVNESESLDDIFGNSQKEESLDDIFGDTGSSQKEESLDDIFGNMNEESVESIFDEKTPKPTTQANPTPVEEEIHAKFGASDIFDLSWKNLLDAYSCTECGRCTAACPANLTGKKLSPRKIMMDVRDRTEEVGKQFDHNPTLTPATFNDGKDLFDFISKEELHACTTCNACVEACPVLINPLDIIVQMRRHLILDKAEAPESWNVMFTNVENNFAPWQFSPADRTKWTED